MSNQRLRILYVSRKREGDGLGEVFRQLFRGKASMKLSGQDGFFEASLLSAFALESRPLEWVLARQSSIGSRCDAVVVNSKYNAPTKRWSDLEWLKTVRKPTLLFCGNAEAHVLPPNEFLDGFDLVYKRELLRHADQYPISEANRKKLRTTMLSCQIVKLDPRSPGHWRKDNFRRKGEPYQYDVFFSGKLKTNPVRQKIVERLAREGIGFYGGLQHQTQGGQRHEQPRLPFEEYEKAINCSKINIAPEGYGQFTHRHLEIWCMGGFCLSTPSIREVTLPLGNPQEGVHYAAFDDLDDMVEKIHYYLAHDEEREAIAAAGRSLFETIYDPARHGEEIRQELQALVPPAGSP